MLGLGTGSFFFGGSCWPRVIDMFLCVIFFFVCDLGRECAGVFVGSSDVSLMCVCV